MEHRRKWALDNLETIANKYCVPTNAVIKQLNVYLSLGLEEAPRSVMPKEKAYPNGREIDAIMAGMNEDGRDAVLRHARELAKIPEYQKNYDQRNH